MTQGKTLKVDLDTQVGALKRGLHKLNDLSNG